MIKRRQFLASLGGLSILGLGYSLLKAPSKQSVTEVAGSTSAEPLPEGMTNSQVSALDTVSASSVEHTPRVNEDIKALDPHILTEDDIKDHLYKVNHFDQTFSEDIFLAKDELAVLVAAIARMNRLQQWVGHGNFSMLGFDEMLKFARRHSDIGEFTSAELSLFERIFSEDARIYGFMGEKVVTSMTALIDKKAGVKIPGSGNYIFKGKPYEMYSRLKKDIGESLILTSGIRSIVKQMYLFLVKVKESDGNLSMASRSLAPPGHSYHAIGDFDVGNIHLGSMNFTAKFADTDEFKKLVQLGYTSIRYTPDNQFGVRYEPWHIKVV